MVISGVYGDDASDALLKPGLVDILVLWLDRDRAAIEGPAHIRRGEQRRLRRVGQQQVLIGRRLEVAVVGGPQHRARGLNVVGKADTRL